MATGVEGPQGGARSKAKRGKRQRGLGVRGGLPADQRAELLRAYRVASGSANRPQAVAAMYLSLAKKFGYPTSHLRGIVEADERRRQGDFRSAKQRAKDSAPMTGKRVKSTGGGKQPSGAAASQYVRATRCRICGKDFGKTKIPPHVGHAACGTRARSGVSLAELDRKERRNNETRSVYAIPSGLPGLGKRRS